MTPEEFDEIYDLALEEAYKQLPPVIDWAKPDILIPVYVEEFLQITPYDNPTPMTTRQIPQIVFRFHKKVVNGAIVGWEQVRN